MEESSSNSNCSSFDDIQLQSQSYTEFDGNDDGVCSDHLVVTPPEVGMVFSSWEKIDTYYRMYGEQEGFGVVRRGGAFKQKAGELTKERKSCVWKCECYGKCRRRFNGEEDVGFKVGKANKKSKKCECPVLMFAALSKNHDWVVKKVVNEHKNHSLPPGKSKLSKSSVKKKLFNDPAPGIEMPQPHNSLSNDRNVVEDMENVHRDLHDGIVKKKRLKFREGDANAFNNLFTELSSAQPFFHSSRFDESNVMKDVMWFDARSQVAYKEFGDVVWFDSSCLTNDYELPLVNLVGVNHHGQSVLFGCALLSHADVDTFQWLFRTWLLFMREKPPGGIVTDQDASIRNALKIVMPTTRHRWHIGHILTKFCNKFRRHERYFELKEQLHNVISYSVTPEEFENGWNSVLKDFRLESSDWLTGLYEEREMWVPAYMNNVIWAGMEINRRVQSEQGFFAGCLEKHIRLSEFAPQYCNILEKMVYDEELADAMTEKYRRQIVYDLVVERVFQKLYTDAKFKEVQSECTKLTFVNVFCWKKKILSDHLLEYPVQDRVWKFCQKSKKEIIPDHSHRRMYKVIVRLKF